MTAIVLLPGMDGTGKMFAELAAHLDGEMRSVIVPYPTDLSLSYRELEDLVRAALPENEPFILLGESFSGPVAISLAASEPAGLIGIILCCTFTRNPLPFLRPLKWLIPILPINAGIVALGMP
ncbi:MAG TPA: alpha/beta hydrolase, partial [Noviherbaspirillum sp.]|uniref:alpha/beta fold hydrolase n=1 Tax=Noviherbaspirillum sp. TaxID=1926288 RepID=UPI002DEFDC43|nr:alpha/beta hydrolase [Noviherbaspirillum sp.]